MLDRISLPEKLVFGLKTVKQTKKQQNKNKNTSPPTTKHKETEKGGSLYHEP